MRGCHSITGGLTVSLVCQVSSSSTRGPGVCRPSCLSSGSVGPGHTVHAVEAKTVATKTGAALGERSTAGTARVSTPYRPAGAADQPGGLAARADIPAGTAEATRGMPAAEATTDTLSRRPSAPAACTSATEAAATHRAVVVGGDQLSSPVPGEVGSWPPDFRNGSVGAHLIDGMKCQVQTS